MKSNSEDVTGLPLDPVPSADTCMPSESTDSSESSDAPNTVRLIVDGVLWGLGLVAALYVAGGLFLFALHWWAS